MFHGCESSMEWKFLEHSLLRSESSRSRGAKVPWNESSWTIRSPGANVPRKVPWERKFSMDFSLPGTKVHRNEKARYRIRGPLQQTPSSHSLRTEAHITFATCIHTVYFSYNASCNYTLALSTHNTDNLA